jgi:hypothetical protein
MSWAMLRGVRSRIGTAAALGALVAVFAMNVPALAFAAPPPPRGPDCLMDPTNPDCQFEGPNIPTGPDDTRCVAMPSAIGCEGGRFDDDDTNNWPGITGDVMW